MDTIVIIPNSMYFHSIDSEPENIIKQNPKNSIQNTLGVLSFLEIKNSKLLITTNKHTNVNIIVMNF